MHTPLAHRPLRLVLFALALSASFSSRAQQHLRDREIHDSDTLAWWHTTEVLSNDTMEGRDTGSPAYQRAADYVANRFKAAGLEPAGENGGFFQTVPMHEIALLPERTRFSLISPGGTETVLPFLQQIEIAPTEGLAPQIEATLNFRRHCSTDGV